MEIGTMDCNGGIAASDSEGPAAVRVATGGGSININSLDGIGEIDSGGGPIKVIDCLRRGLLFYLINVERYMLCIYCFLLVTEISSITPTPDFYQVHVNERVLRVRLVSHGGDVKLIISPEVSVDISVFGASGGTIGGDSGERRKFYFDYLI